MYSKNNKEEAEKEEEKALLPINITQKAGTGNEYNLLQKKKTYENIENKFSVETDNKSSQKNSEIKEIVINDNNSNGNGNRGKDKKLRFF